MDITSASQTLQPVRDEFLVRFYHWSTEFSRHEFGGDFPIIGRIKSPTVQRLLSFARSLNGEERFVLCSALLKRFHTRAVEVLEDVSSIDETAILGRYSEARRTYSSQLEAVVSQSSKASLRKTLLRKLGATFSEPPEIQPSREEWTYRSHIRCWTLETTIDSGGRRSFGYSHSIMAQHSVPLQDHISILSWMGISSQTDWFYLSESDYGEAAECLAQACSCFLDAVPKLLNDLSHELPEPEVRAWREAVTVKGHRQNGMTIVVFDTPELRKAFQEKATWDIPTSIIPERLRTIGSHFVVIQDPIFSQESMDLLALSPTYRHVRVEPLNERNQS
jgi:hypothetical protein